MSEAWKDGILHARKTYDIRRGAILSRTALAQLFRRLMQTCIEPAFREVAEFAADQDLACAVECEVGGVQPHVVFRVKSSGRSISYELVPDGSAVREVESVHDRPLGQRGVWLTADALQRQLTPGYARASAASIVQDHFRTVPEASDE